MKIVSLVENHSNCGLKAAHGLSLYIETKKHKILFDLGPDDTLIENAKRLNIDLSEIDTVVISHGHADHGGALELFLSINNKARIYIQQSAFLPHFSHRKSGIADIGLQYDLKSHPQVVLLNGNYVIDSELELFTVTSHSPKCWSLSNNSLYEGEELDSFNHEQNLVVKSLKTALILGCGHNGIVNIMEQGAHYFPNICVGGFHLTKPSDNIEAPTELLDEIAKYLATYPSVKFYTCHCTGQAAYEYLKNKIDNIYYLNCGDEIK